MGLIIALLAIALLGLMFVVLELQNRALVRQLAQEHSRAQRLGAELDAANEELDALTEAINALAYAAPPR